MANDINEISLSDFFWIEFKSNRVSFSFKGLPKGIHFTVAWDNKTGTTNLHITKNVGNSSDKPRFDIVISNKIVLDQIMSFAPAEFFLKIFAPISFKRYSRKERKNIRLIYLDNLEDGQTDILIKEKITEVWPKVSDTRRKGKNNKLKVHDGFDNAFLPLVNSKQIQTLLLNKIQPLTSRSFNTHTIRGGIIFISKRSYPFIAENNKCYAVTTKLTIYELLTSFANLKFAKEIIDYVNEALDRLPHAKSSADTKPFNRPYQLFIEKAC